MSEKRIVVRGYHLDLYNHVNHARYLEFLEEARWTYFEEKHPIEWFVQNGIGFVIANININYRKPAVLNQVLVIKTNLAKTGTKSVVVEQVIYLEGIETIVADASVTIVMVDLKTGKSMLINDELREMFS